MLRYRVAYDPERGHFVLPALAAVVHPDDVFISRAAAQGMAEARNARLEEPRGETDPDSASGSVFLRTFLRRASA